MNAEPPMTIKKKMIIKERTVFVVTSNEKRSCYTMETMKI
jgi:hypothetical protein